ncbi:MAG: hypothetical protein J6N21_09925 [Butyrivibrio sp.]|nr:hypothetical protein [Butyrivibrio sp.]
MFVSNANVIMMYFKDDKAFEKNTDKVIYGRLSESQDKFENGSKVEGQYTYESWNARFVGEAKKAVESLDDKSLVTLKSFDVRQPYDKEKNRSYPYVLVSKLEVGAHKKGEESPLV